jgi:NTE family protein
LLTCMGLSISCGRNIKCTKIWERSAVSVSANREGPAGFPNLGVALSGGGVRAAVFHLGVLRYLADKGAMERITSLSTVSGGSLVIAAVMTIGAMRWPDSAGYRDTIYPTLRDLLTTRDLFSLRALGVRGVMRHNRALLNRRADILVDLLARQWNITATLSDLPEMPLWWINTTCLETGKNWRFSKREMGDWQFGRHYTPPFSLAEAVAASAAVP